MTDTSPQPNDQMVEPALGDEEMEAWLNSLNDDVNLPALMDHKPTAQEDEGAEDEPTGDDDQEEEEEPQEGDDDVVVNGQKIPRSEIQRLYEFDQYMRSNPDTANRVAEALKPVSREPAVPPQAEAPANEEWTEPTPPDYLDLEDPRDKFTWDSMVNLQKSQFEMGQQQRQFLISQAQERQAQIQRQAKADMDQALLEFRTNFPGLNDDDIVNIRQEAAPFVDGMMAKMEPVPALYRSMEVAAYANTDLRKKLETETPTPTTRQRSNHRKQRLGAIAGTPRSAPKVETRPSFVSDRDMINAVASEIADNLAGR